MLRLPFGKEAASPKGSRAGVCQKQGWRTPETGEEYAASFPEGDGVEMKTKKARSKFSEATFGEAEALNQRGQKSILCSPYGKTGPCYAEAAKQSDNA